MIFGNKFKYKHVRIVTIAHCLFISSSVFLSGCFVANEVEVKTRKAAKDKSTTSPLPPVTVSKIEVINHQIIITGTNLASVSQFKIKEGSTNTNLQIESKTSTTIVANTLSNVTFAAGKILDFIFTNAEAASTFTVNFSLCDSTLGGKGFNCLITPNDKEVLSYDAASGKWKPRAVNGLSYQGAWDANDPQPTSTTAGDYFIVSVANGPYSVGDWIVFNGASFDHINNSSAITTVFGRTGVVTANEADYVLDKMGDVDLTTSPPITGDVLKYNGTRWVPGVVSAGSGGTVTNVSASAPISVSNGTSTPAITIAQANTTTSGYLTNTDWNTFNNKQPAIAAGTTAQYYRGDKTWQTLDTLSVPENTNLYFTNARVLGVPLTGFSTATGAVVATDSILAAIGKLQGQMNLKSDATGFVDWSTAGVATLEPTRLNLTTADRAVVTNASGVPTASSVTTTELGYVSGVTSSIQTQLNAKQATIDKSTVQDVSKVRIYGANTTNYVELSASSLTGNHILNFPDSDGSNGHVLTTDGSGNLSWSAPSGGGGTPAAGSVTNAEVSATANIAQSKIANLTTDLAGKEPTLTAAGNTTTYYRGDKTWATLNTTVVPEGTNQYYTNARGIGSTITAPTLTNSAISTGDTLQVVAGKLQAQFNNVLNIALTGLSTATSSAITAADTIIDGFGKLQAQINTNVAADANKLSKNSNDSITATVTVSGAGDIIVPSTPAGMTSAVNKTYVDDRIANASNQWSVNGSSVYRASGSVGVGTSTPATTEGVTVHVVNTLNDGSVLSNTNIISESQNRAGYLTTVSSATSVGAVNFRTVANSTAGQGQVKYDHPTKLMTFATNNINRMAIDTNGLVGIGTSSPVSILDVAGGTGNTAARFTNYGNIAHLGVLRAEGSQGTPTNISAAGTDIGGLTAAAYDGSAFQTLGWLRFSAETAITGAANTAGYISMATRPTGGASSLERMRITSTGNVGIGTSSPNYLLEVQAPSGSGSLGTLSLKSDRTTSTNHGGLYFNSKSSHLKASILGGGPDSATGGYLNFLTQNTSGVDSVRMSIDSSGYIGIGTQTPGSNLHIYGASPALVSDGQLNLQGSETTGAAGTGAGITFTGSDGVNHTRAWGSVQTFKENSTVGDVASYMRFATRQSGQGAAEKMRITSTGYVGVGTTTPRGTMELSTGPSWSGNNIGANLVISGTRNNSIGFLDHAGTNAFAMGSFQTVGFGIFSMPALTDTTTTPGYRFVISNTGNVGIGEQSPSSKLDVAGAIEFSTGKGYLGYYNINPYDQTEIGAIGASTSLSLVTNGVSRLNILPTNGNVGIGNTTPTAKLDVTGNVLVSSSISTNATYLTTGGIANGSNGNVVSSGGNAAACYNSGWGFFGYCTSLRQTKRDIKDLSLGLDTVLKLRPVSFTWKNNNERDLGFIAEEVEKVDPLMAQYTKNKLSGVKYNSLSSLLAKAIQEFYGKFLELEKVVAILIDGEETNARDIASIKEKMDKQEAEIKALRQQNESLRNDIQEIKKALKAK